MNLFSRSVASVAGAYALALLLSGCAGAPGAAADGPLHPQAEAFTETVWALTPAQTLLRVRAGQPDTVAQRLPVSGLAPGETLVAMDFRVSRGVLYGLSNQARLYTLDTRTGQATPVAATASGWALHGPRVGLDFNPAADRVRVVTEAGQNLRIHPDTGLAVDHAPATPGLQPDGALAYAPDDPAAGRLPRVVAAGYTYPPKDPKRTTNYAIDLAQGTLVMQGSREGDTPVVSPNTGQLRTVGPLGVAGLAEADLDIADVKNTALAALRTRHTQLYVLNLATGQAQRLGRLADGGPVLAIAIEP